MSKTNIQREVDNVVQLAPKARAAQRELPLFQLNILLTINASFERTATARQVTDLASFLLGRRIDGAQTHIALTRLIKRKLVEIEDPVVKPRQFKVTAEGLILATHTIAVMRRVLANSPGLPVGS